MKNKILVIGDSCIDRHVYGKITRLCPEAPVPILVPTKTTENGGMAANVYENIKSLGANVDIVTNEEKTTKTRYIDEYTNQMIIRVDTDKPILPPKYFNWYGDYDAVVISDYNKGFLNDTMIREICRWHPLVFVDTKRHITYDVFGNAKFIKINEHEYVKNMDLWTHKGEGFKFEEKLVITRGRDGCDYMGKNYPVEPVDVKDMSGAGDTFLSGLVVKYVETRNIETAIEYANMCATIVVQHRGVSRVGDYL